MRQADAMTIVHAHENELRQRGVSALYLFGSVVRNEAGPNSDVDVLVELDHTPTLFELARLRMDLESWFGRRVDLGLRDSVREPLRRRIDQEAVRAA